MVKFVKFKVGLSEIKNGDENINTCSHIHTTVAHIYSNYITKKLIKITPVMLRDCFQNTHEPRKSQPSQW